MNTMISSLRAIAVAGAALPLLSAMAAAETELSRDDFVAGCTSGALGTEQPEEACTCAYDFLLNEASELVREAMFIRVRDGDAAQAAFLQQSGGDNQDEVMTSMAEEGERLIGNCGLADE